MKNLPDDLKELAKNSVVRKVTINEVEIESNQWKLYDKHYDESFYFDTEEEAKQVGSEILNNRQYPDCAGVDIRKAFESVFEVIEEGKDTRQYKTLASAKAVITRENNQNVKTAGMIILMLDVNQL